MPQPQNLNPGYRMVKILIATLWACSCVWTELYVITMLTQNTEQGSGALVLKSTMLNVTEA